MVNKHKGITATVPANLLIGGEYIILEEQGTGIAIATYPLAKGNASISENTIIHTMTDETIVSFNSKTHTNNSPFIIRVYHYLYTYLQKAGYTLPSLEITLDTTSFFSKKRKKGFGSSSAVTVLLAGLMFAWALKGKTILRKEIVKASLEAHRHAQGKIGSGYDIFTSCYGYGGIFIGGKNPQWIKLSKNHPLFSAKFYTFQGTAETDSRKAIQHYQKWSEKFPDEKDFFFQKSQNLVQKIKTSSSEKEFFQYITELRLLSIKLGNHIGVESWILPPETIQEPFTWKSSGAGNELGILFLNKQSKALLPQNYEHTHIHTEGLQFNNSNSILS